MAADIELGLDFEDIAGADLGDEGVGRGERIFDVALADDLSAEGMCRYRASVVLPFLKVAKRDHAFAATA